MMMAVFIHDVDLRSLGLLRHRRFQVWRCKTRLLPSEQSHLAYATESSSLLVSTP